MRLKNTSSDVVEYVEISPEMDYDLAVFRQDGSPAPRTGYGRRLAESERWAGRRISRSLAPGEEATETVEITKLFDLAHPGKYYARVSHVITRIPQTPAVEVAFSNPVAFTITE
jgi:hypothetical protein